MAQDFNLLQAINLIKQQTAGLSGTAARKAARSFTGSSTSGAFAGRQGDIFAQRSSAIAGATATLIPQFLRIKLERERFEEEKKRGRFSDLFNIGTGIAGIAGGLPGLLAKYGIDIARGQLDG